MARLAEFTGRLYLDTNIFIYALEGYSVFRPILTPLFETIDRGSIHAITSELTLAEVLVKPLLDRSREREAAYLQAIRQSTSLHLEPVSRDILIAAAHLRAELGLKLPDAIHAATATITHCERLLTNDARFKTLPGIEVLVLSEL